MAAVSSLLREACTYTACYCEENVYLLITQLREAGARLGDLFVVFVSNPSKQVPLWRQLAGGPHGLVVWDYHVLLVERRDAGPALVWDLDSTLPFPCPLQRYAFEALAHGTVPLPPQMARLFRVVPAAEYLQHFASDRSHMLDEVGAWQQPPPPYPCITAADGSTHTLPLYMEMPPSQGACQSAHAVPAALETGGQYGAVLTEAVFLAYFDGGQ